MIVPPPSASISRLVSRRQGPTLLATTLTLAGRTSATTSTTLRYSRNLKARIRCLSCATFFKSAVQCEHADGWSALLAHRSKEEEEERLATWSLAALSANAAMTSVTPMTPATSVTWPMRSLCNWNREYCLSNRYLSTSAASTDDCGGDDDGDDASGRPTTRRRLGVRNVAIVAHVDHGKTTLVDELLKIASSSSVGRDDLQSSSKDNGDGNDGNDGDGQPELNRLMDSGELEKERGITITSKVTRLDYRRTPERAAIINVVDTPGHADFAGEVDRILSTVDGIVLVVDAAEGPKSQTKYVLSRALQRGLVPIVVINKVDRHESMLRLESGETEIEILELFETLSGEDDVHYRTLFGSARSGWVTEDLSLALEMADKDADQVDRAKSTDPNLAMTVLLDAILDDIPAPMVHWYDNHATDPDDHVTDTQFESQPFSMTATTVGYDPYLGRTCTGRIYSGKIESGDTVMLLPRDTLHTDDNTPNNNNDNNNTSNNTPKPTSQISGIFANRGVSRVPLDPPTAHAGDIVTLTGVPDALKVGDTLASNDNRIDRPVDTPPLAPPTLSCLFGANNGPLAGREGTIVASSRVRARLISETDNNVTLTVEKCETDPEKTVVYGRGELQIGILVEQMRREGYEMILTPPQILTTTCPHTNQKLEPYEEVIVDVDSEYAGTVVNSLTGPRRGTLIEMSDDGQNTNTGKTRMKFEVPSRGLLGFGPEIATATRGTAVMHHCYLEDREYAGTMGAAGTDKGKLVSNEMGKATLFALEGLSARGTLFVEPGDMVYPGMIIGENNKSGDLEVNPVKSKATSNMRTQSKEEKMYLPPPKKYTVEELIGIMSDDEVIEVTPQSVRWRKLELDAGVRERLARAKKKKAEALLSKQGKKGGRK